ncbi:MAG: LytTR family DNA-binding domain-containing protein [Lachnospiraceae bacterium]|nr:LytTR family DNA-binding domain-containing protein [Robinsoniella sp.]MDY3767589.1 LytTR family DNA-binding domain-containing protein [Lachnospiraceae bacterium]
MAYRIAICDDDNLALRVLISLIKKEFIRHSISVTVDAYQDSRQLKAKLTQVPYDALFLDVDMPALSGIALACFQRELSPSIVIIFISNHPERVFDALAAEPLRFLRKQYLERELPEAVDALLKKLHRSGEEKLMLMSGTSLRTVFVKDILYVESFNKVQNVVLKHETLPVRYTIQYLEEQLEPYHFFRPHRCFLVNPNCIYSIEKNELILDNGQSLPISRNHLKETKEHFRKALSL